jgi:hypothetical protein
VLHFLLPLLLSPCYDDIYVAPVVFCLRTGHDDTTLILYANKTTEHDVPPVYVVFFFFLLFFSFYFFLPSYSSSSSAAWCTDLCCLCVFRVVVAVGILREGGISSKVDRTSAAIGRRYARTVGLQ